MVTEKKRKFYSESKFIRKIIITFNYLIWFSYQSIINAQTNIVEAFPNLSFSNPIEIQHANDDSNRLFVVSQSGIINVFENNNTILSSTIFLDIRDKVSFGGELGLLGLAFHPDYKSNGYFYLDYSANNPRRTIISRFTVSSSNPNEADISSELILLEVEQPYSNHNGGKIAFGPDGFLYISLGDGGSGGDPENRAQNLSTLLGKIIRIDIDNQDVEKNYSIPDDNPFKGNNENFAEEIYAYGLRNVWKFSFDSSDRLWAADVGQNAWEEINLIENGGNYGWRIMEGFHCYNPQTGCNQEGLILPILEYNHSSAGGYSITGGYVFEGTSVPELTNKYVYADFVTGNIWAYDPINGSNLLIDNFNAQISTFGIDENNNLYFADYNSGSIFKFVDDNINSIESTKPNVIQLYQNYPNPFNPTTTISYTISNSNEGNKFVTLDVFNTLGEKILVLVDKYQMSGNYQIEFNTKKISQSLITSGVYFYRLRTNDYMEIKKMVILN